MIPISMQLRSWPAGRFEMTAMLMGRFLLVGGQKMSCNNSMNNGVEV